jgi:DNA repair ATPase RecN
VESFSCPGGADVRTAQGRTVLVRGYVDQLAKVGIWVCAITDYNGIRTEWFDLIKAEARNRGIVVLPGVEVSFRTPKYGLHVLAIFPETASPEEINSFLRALDRDPAKPLLLPGGGHRDIELTTTNEQGALQRLRERFGCLLVIPHPDGSNGLLQSFRPADAAGFLAEVRPDAIEHCPESALRKIKSERSMEGGFFANLAQVEFSDAHRIDEIGTKKRQDGAPRVTYLKLSAAGLEALRLALHDPETRLFVGGVPPQADHARIRRMTVSGSGFLGNLAIEWNDDLNVLIGGRGVGKSAIIETLRYALAMRPYSDHSYREDLVRHALGSGGKVELVLERPVGNGKTRQYLVTRVWGEEPRVTEAGSRGSVALRPFDLLGPTGGPTIFGQREIHAVSESEAQRLAILDQLIGEEARSRAAAVEQAIERLRISARSILDVRKKVEKRDEYRQRLKAIEHEIEIYERHAAAEKLREATRLRADGQHLKSAAEAVARVRKEWTEGSQDFLAPLETAYRSLLRGQSQQKAILQAAAGVVETLHRDLKAVLEQGESLLKEAERGLGELGNRWREALRPLEDEINRIKQEAQTEVLDPDRLLKLTEERTALAPIIEELNRSEDHLKELWEQRMALLTAVREARHAEHELRRQRADEIGRLLQERLRLKVEFKGQKEDYKKRIGALLRGSGVTEAAIDRLVAPEATDGLALADAVRTGAEEVQTRFGLTPANADRLVKWLTGDESRLLELETLIPPDALHIELKVDDQYRPLDRLSVGQRATAVLLLLFALEGRVLVLDQPEDDLDNRFVYEDIVQILRDQKGLTSQKERRQIIAATHNANIPVIGDAELVLALDLREGRADVVGRASIDDTSTRELVKSIMEGGEEAFRRRAEKYDGQWALP